MQTFSRKPDESIVIDGRITVKVLRIEGDGVKLGIVAPREMTVHRQEVYEEVRKANCQAVTPRSSPVPRLSVAQHPL
jgi:carbon storage regulator